MNEVTENSLALFQKSQEQQKAYEFDSGKYPITVFPGVFSPAFFNDSCWYADNVSSLVRGSRMLEIGTGTGIVSLTAALNKTEVVATDINPAAVANAKHNFARYGLSIPVYEGDMFEPVLHEEKFDFILWNHPFLSEYNPKENALLQAGFDFKFRNLRKYFAQAGQFLNQDGKILLGTSNVVERGILDTISHENGYKSSLECEESMVLSGHPERDNLYRIFSYSRSGTGEQE